MESGSWEMLSMVEAPLGITWCFETVHPYEESIAMRKPCRDWIRVLDITYVNDSPMDEIPVIYKKRADKCAVMGLLKYKYGI
jgi:hypothetical protein